ncbi:MAG: ATP-grasp fold amidoligase family protein, partial [Vitreimonas sp.]
DWTRLDFTLKYPASPADVPAPPHLADMVRAAQVLAEGLRFVRVDLYDTPAGPLFGEMTFAPEAGLCQFDPQRLDIELGESWSYPAPRSASAPATTAGAMTG